MRLIKVMPLLLIFLGLLPSCCDEVIPHFMPGTLENEVYLNSQLYADLEDVELDSVEGLQLWLSFDDLEFIAEKQFDFALQNRCYATQPCPIDGHLGLKSAVADLTITSSAEFQGIAAGEEITEHFHKLEYVETDDEGNAVYEENSVSSSYEQFSYLNYSMTYLELNFSELPGNDEAHQFTVELTFEDGTNISAVSESVQF